MLPASPRIASPSLRRLIAATSLVALGATLALPLSGMAVPARAQSQGPSTSGGNLPYIAAGQSEEEVQKRKRARAEAEEKARQEAARTAAEEEKTRQEAARAAQPAEVAPAVAPTVTATVPPAAPAPATASVTPTAPAAPKPVAAAAKPRQGELPPGVNPALAADPRAVVPISPPQQRPSVAAAPQPQPQHGVVVVRRPMFFGLFGPEVNVTERVVVLTPPANVGSTQAAPRPPAAVGQPKVVSRKPTSNCHYHAAPAAGMGYAHRDVQCHWHENPGDPTLRYVD